LRITVKAFASFREVIGGSGHMNIEIPEGSSIEDLIQLLQERLRPKIDLRILLDASSGVKTLVNGREIAYLEGVKTRLSDGDVVAFIPPVGGG